MRLENGKGGHKLNANPNPNPNPNPNTKRPCLPNIVVPRLETRSPAGGGRPAWLGKNPNRFLGHRTSVADTVKLAVPDEKTFEVMRQNVERSRYLQ
ncbi:protein of unknown function (plasmid) [Cupriavidus taiwanensis]|uniref:Uncharacterized protein n=1 Tax=Cupriavidus taiwanensis TaxID=164546 RepID=A0A375EDR3_9BURK|nr:protein of unknown function [Cupriavidus taiwanensis]